MSQSTADESCSPARCAIPARTSIHVHVVEDHDEALPHIYRAIATKTLPFKGSVLIHFDAHPDLLSPDIKADDVSDKEVLFSKTSIADWILPAIYMGHIGRMVWIKPPWAVQIQEGAHCLCVGKDRDSGQIRVSTPLPYFISELLCVDVNDLDDVITIPLDVTTLLHTPPPLPQEDHSQEPARDDLLSPPNKTMKLGGTGDNEVHLCSFDEGVIKCVDDSKAWILDIDLDFFSTGNPFRSIYSEEQYRLLQRLYKLEEPDKEKSNAVTECIKKRERQLSCLEQLWSCPNITEKDKIVLKMDDNDVALLEEMKDMMGSIRNDSFIDSEYFHMSGMVTDLPVHFSTEEEVRELVSLTSDCIRKITKRPSLITISRSAEDDYTPPEQVEDIQRQVLSLLESIYNTRSCDPHHKLEIHKHYS